MDITQLSQSASWLIIITLTSFTYLSWQKPLYGIYLIAAALPSYLIRLTIFGLPTTVLELAILLLFFVWLLKNFRWKSFNVRWWKREKTYNAIPTTYRIPLILILSSSFIAMVISSSQPDAFGIFKAYFLEPIFFLIILVYEVKRLATIERIMQLLGLSVIVIGMIALWQSATGIGIPIPFWADAATRRITTFYGYPNANSLFVAPIIALYLSYAFKSDRIHVQLYKIAVLAFGIFTILAAKTTGAIVAIVIAAWILLFRLRRARSLIVAGTIIIITLFLSSNQIQDLWTPIQQNISQNHLDLKSTSLEIRISQWRESFAYLADHPLLGTGLANYKEAIEPYHAHEFIEIYLYPHNIFLNFWTELGLMGLIGFIWLLFITFKTLINTLQLKHYQHERTWLTWALLGAWTTILIHGLVDVPYFKNDLSVLWMLLVGLTILTPLVLSQQKRSNK